MKSPALDPRGAFFNQQHTKNFYLDRLRNHREAAQINRNFYSWDSDTMDGCAVGCTIHAEDLSEYQPQLNLPSFLATVTGVIHLHLPRSRADFWGEQIIEAIAPGSDVIPAADNLVYWLLTDPTFRTKAFPEDLQLLDLVASLYQRRLNADEPTTYQWRKARIKTRLVTYLCVPATSASGCSHSQLLRWTAATTDNNAVEYEKSISLVNNGKHAARLLAELGVLNARKHHLLRNILMLAAYNSPEGIWLRIADQLLHFLAKKALRQQPTTLVMPINRGRLTA